MRDMVEIGMGRTARRTYELDDVDIVPSRRTRSSKQVSLAWQLDAYRFDIPLVAHPTDALVSPEFAIELSKYCQKNKLTLPVPLGDCRKDQMPAEVIQYLDKTLEPARRKTDAGKVDLETLQKAQGIWPDYPKLIVELAKKHKLPIPGWTLPGPPQIWDRVRAGKPKAIK